MNIRTVDNGVADCTAGPHHEVKSAGRQCRLTRDNLSECPRAGGYQIRRLENDGVTKGEGRGDLPDRCRHGKIPGADDGHDPDGLSTGVDLDAGSHGLSAIIDVAMNLRCEIVEELARTINLPNPFSASLTIFSSE